MKLKKYGRKNNERGTALLIAIFALMILAAVGMGMIYTANTETSVNSNYRQSQQAYFAARAGLEQARDMLLSGGITKLPNAKSTENGTGKGLPGQQRGAAYIINPAAGETVAPWDPSNKFFDDEFCQEYLGSGIHDGVKCGAAQVPSGSWYNSQTAAALSGGAAPLPFKWVRVTLKTNQSSSPWVVDGSRPGDKQACYDGRQELSLMAKASQPSSSPFWKPELGFSASDTLGMFWFGKGGSGNGGGGGGGGTSTCTSVPAGTTGATACGCGSTIMPADPFVAGAQTCVDAGLEPIYVLTSLAVTGNGTRRMMQQEVSRVTTPWPPAALSFAGPVNSVNFGTSDQYTIDGRDIVNNPTNKTAGTSLSDAPCGPDVPSAGATQDRMGGDPRNPTGFEQVVNASLGAKTPFQGADSGTNTGQCSPSSSDVRDATQAMGSNLSTPAQLQMLLQNMINIADYIGPASDVTNPGTDASPKITVIQNRDGSPADCNKCSAFSGSGVLVVTGNLTTAGQTTFNGLVIVLGGTLLMDGTSNVNGGLILGNMNTVNGVQQGINMDVSGGGGVGGVHYDSCRIINAQNKKAFKILATREVMY